MAHRLLREAWHEADAWPGPQRLRGQNHSKERADQARRPFPRPDGAGGTGGGPNLELVQNTPLSSPNGAPVNELLETDEKGIFAAGDIALFPDRIFGGVQRIQHYENARLQGHIAGQNMTGKKRVRFEAMPFFWSEMFDLRFDFIGDFSLPAAASKSRGTGQEKSS